MNATLEVCDRHPVARAAYMMVKGNGELHFCGHCYNARKDELIRQGWMIRLDDYIPRHSQVAS